MTSKLLPAFFILSCGVGMQRQEGRRQEGRRHRPKAARQGRVHAELRGTWQGVQGGRRYDVAQKYLHKVVELTGTLRLGLTAERQPILWMEIRTGEFLDVQCISVSKEPWKKRCPARPVTVKGKGPEFALGAALIECEIVDAKGDAPATTTPSAGRNTPGPRRQHQEVRQETARGRGRDREGRDQQV